MREVVARGPEGSEFLGFLAALGAFVALARRWPDAGLAWTYRLGWKPVFCVREEDLSEAEGESPEDAVVRAAHESLRVSANLWRWMAEESEAGRCPTCKEAGDLQLSTGRFRELPTDRLAELGRLLGEGADDDKRVWLTPLVMLTGGSHQHFLLTARHLLEGTMQDDLRRALFEPWSYPDTDKALTLRLDPSDDRSYAYGPGDPRNTKVLPIRSQKGANRLALEAFFCFPVYPVGIEGRGSQRTPRFAIPTYRGQEGEEGLFVWPVWKRPLSASVLSSLLTLPDLQDVSARDKLEAMGIGGVFQARRYTRERGRYISRGSPLWSAP